MKIWTSGARFFGGQIDRIESGFKSLGHELAQDISEADLVYCNNAWYDDVINFKKAGRVKGKMIFTVLDLAPHLGSQFPVEKLEEQLEFADAICSISETVQKDLAERTGKFSTVIYQPIKNIVKLDKKPKSPFKVLFVGRVNDPNKRAGLGAEAIKKLGYKAQEVITIGSDQPFFGGTWGEKVADEVLNMTYNSVDFVICCSRHEGIGLPAIEAMAAGTIPVICSDLSTRHDFFNNISEYENVKPNPDSVTAFMSGFIKDPVKMQTFKDKLHYHYLQNLSHKMCGVGVAESILKVYDRLR